LIGFVKYYSFRFIGMLLVSYRVKLCTFFILLGFNISAFHFPLVFMMIRAIAVKNIGEHSLSQRTTQASFDM
jgi:hypothetical protein